MMKKIRILTVITVLSLLALTLTACGRSEFGLTENTEKRMLITAENADKDAFFMTGTLEVDDSEQIVISSDLKKGKVRVEIVRMSEEQSIDKLPETDKEATIAANLVNTDSASGTVAAGSYMLRATCLEKATGTVQIEVKPA